MTDPGTTAINYLHNELIAEPEVTVSDSTGFTWWPCDLAQRIWAEPGVQKDGLNVTRIHVQTDYLKNVQDLAAASKHLAQSHLGLAGFVRDAADKTRIKLVSSAYVDEQTVTYMPNMLATAAINHVLFVNEYAESDAALMNAEADITASATLGDKPHLGDNPARALSAIHENSGAQSLWRGAEMIEACALTLIYTPAGKCAPIKGDENQFVAHMTCRDRIYKMGATTAIKHHLLGNGICCYLILQHGGDELENSRTALYLNETELQLSTGVDSFGAWQTSAGGLFYESFLPNAVYLPGILNRTMKQMYIRAACMDQLGR